MANAVTPGPLYKDGLSGVPSLGKVKDQSCKTRRPYWNILLPHCALEATFWRGLHSVQSPIAITHITAMYVSEPPRQLFYWLSVTYPRKKGKFQEKGKK